VIAVAVNGAQCLDLLGPIEVLDSATTQAPDAGYEVQVVAPGGGLVTFSNGVTIHADPVPSPPPRHDTLLIAGGRGARAAVADEALVAWIGAASSRARRTASVCTGAYLLAAAGLLSGRRATTHWQYCDALAARHPEVTIDPDALYIHDGDIWTSAGITAGIDMTLALVEEDLGADIALTVARELVVFLKRPGGQTQFSRALAAQQAELPALRELQAWIAGHLDEDLSVANLAARAHRPSALSRGRSAARSGKRPLPMSRRCASSEPGCCSKTAPSRSPRSLARPDFAAPKCFAGPSTGASG
jgi:transcriptional regulator GlxA family with amidase domain